MFSLESPHRGDSNENTQYTIFNTCIKKSHYIILNLHLWDFSKGLMNEFETAVVDEPSVFEPLKVYCITSCGCMMLQRIITLRTVKMITDCNF